MEVDQQTACDRDGCLNSAICQRLTDTGWNKEYISVLHADVCLRAVSHVLKIKIYFLSSLGSFTNQFRFAQSRSLVPSTGEGEGLHYGDGGIVIDQESARLQHIANDVYDACFRDDDGIAWKNNGVLLRVHRVWPGLQRNGIGMLRITTMHNRDRFSGSAL